MELFKEYERTDHNFKYPLENDFTFYDRVNNLNFGKIRELLNSWFSKYPIENKNKLYADFRAKFYDAFYELVIYIFLRECQLNPQIEIKDTKTSQTPDFFCTKEKFSFFIEATVAKGVSEYDIKIQNLKESLYAKFGKLLMPHYFLNLEKLDFKVNKQPKLREIYKVVQSGINSLSQRDMELIDKYQFEDANFPKVSYNDDIVDLILSFIPRNNPDYVKYFSPIGMYPTSYQYMGIENSIPKSIEKKIKKYSNLELNYFIFVNSHGSIFYRKDDLMWHLYGSDHFTNEVNMKPLFNSSKAINLLGVIVTNVVPANLHRFEMDLYINPFHKDKKKIFNLFACDFEENKNVYFNINVRERLNIKSDFLPYDLWEIL